MGSIIQIGNIIIEKVHNKDGNLWYLSYKDLDDPGYEYREYQSGTKEWFRNDKLHREGGPAMIYEDGSEIWFKNGKFHREDGPAIIKPNGLKSWFKNDKAHREDGPAINYPDGTKEWWINGMKYSEEEFNEKIKRRNA